MSANSSAPPAWGKARPAPDAAVLDAGVEPAGVVEDDVLGPGPAGHLPPLDVVEHLVGGENAGQGGPPRRSPGCRVGQGVGLFAGPVHDAPPGAGRGSRLPPRLRLPHRVAQSAQRARRQLDLVAGREPPAGLDPAAPRDGAEPDHRARCQPLARAGVGDDVRHGVLHPGGAAGAPPLAVDADLDGQLVQGAQELVRGDHDGAERGTEVLGLGRPHEALDHLAELYVAGAEVVEQHEAADCGEGLLAGQVGAVPGDDDADLELVVQRLGVGRPADGIAVADERGRVALVVQRLLVPQRAGTQPRERAPGQPLVAVAHRPGDRLTQPQQAAGHTDHVLGPQ